MQPATVYAAILRALQGKEQRVMASKLLDDLDHSMIRSAKNISESMTVLDKSKLNPNG